jgi:hypothetical protein
MVGVENVHFSTPSAITISMGAKLIVRPTGARRLPLVAKHVVGTVGTQQFKI